MRIHLINLARRQDRLGAMETQAARLGLTLSRVEPWMRGEPIRALTQNSKGAAPWAKFHWGDKACTLSHVKCWKEFLDSGDSHAAILEDDVVLRDGAGIVLKDAAWIPKAVGLVKLEHYGPARQSVLLSDFTSVAPGFQLARMHSRHTGAAAYILTRGVAQRLLAEPRFNLPVDHLLFNPNNSPLFASLSPWQLLPAVARQQDFIGDKSDIEGWRVGMRKLTPGYAKRELIRFGYDLKLLPRQLGLVLSGRAKFTRMLDKAGSPSPRPALTRKPRR